MKKAFCILTAILLLLTAMIPVSAIEEVEPQAACQHEYLLITYNTVYSFRNSTYHRAHTIRIAECTSCGLKFESTVSLADEVHDTVYTHAECNGTTQTHTLKCKYCHASFTETIRFPNAPHGHRPCVVLPLRLIFEIA